jgi:hypothetical protein
LRFRKWGKQSLCAKNLATVLTVQGNKEAVLSALENDLTMEMKMRNVT